MFKRNAFVATVLAISFNLTTPVRAQADDAVGKDLKVTIALQGQSCDEVVDVKRNGDSDYLATCKDGNRYRVFVDAQGRVVVKKQ